MILSNIDRDSFAASNRKLGVAFDAVYTAAPVAVPDTTTTAPPETTTTTLPPEIEAFMALVDGYEATALEIQAEIDETNDAWETTSAEPRRAEAERASITTCPGVGNERAATGRTALRGRP